MPGRGDSDRRRVWQARLRRFAESDLSVAAFCRQERVSAPTFYEWRRKLGGTNGRRSGARREAPLFVPVQIEPAAAAVELRLPNGVVVSLPAGDAATLAAAIAAAARIPATTDGEGAAC
jgi:transposase-like protein